jgi:hypothetical protein
VVIAPAPPATGFRVVAVENYDDGVVVRCQLVAPAPLPAAAELSDDTRR